MALANRPRPRGALGASKWKTKGRTIQDANWTLPTTPQEIGWQHDGAAGPHPVLCSRPQQCNVQQCTCPAAGGHRAHNDLCGSRLAAKGGVGVVADGGRCWMGVFKGRTEANSEHEGRPARGGSCSGSADLHAGCPREPKEWGVHGCIKEFLNASVTSQRGGCLACWLCRVARQRVAWHRLVMRGLG